MLHAQNEPSRCHPLVVDDDPDFTVLLRRCLEKVGVPRLQIRSSIDGEDAIRVLSKDGEIPSFILLDLHMPRRSGLEVLEWVRSATPPLSKALVFMLTSSSSPDHMARAFELGIGSYFIKPLEISALERILEGIVAYWNRRDWTGIIPGNMEEPGSSSRTLRSPASIRQTSGP